MRKEWILKEYLTRQTLTLGFNNAHTSAMSNNDNKSDFNLFNFFFNYKYWQTLLIYWSVGIQIFWCFSLPMDIPSCFGWSSFHWFYLFSKRIKLKRNYQVTLVIVAICIYCISRNGDLDPLVGINIYGLLVIIKTFDF